MRDTNELKPENETNMVPASFDDTEETAAAPAEVTADPAEEAAAPDLAEPPTLRAEGTAESIEEAKPEEVPNASGFRPAKMQTDELDVSVEEKPSAAIQEDEAAHAEKLAQIREALSMVNPRTEEPAPKAKPGVIPPLRKKGTKGNTLKRATMDTATVAPKAPAKPAAPAKAAAPLPPLRKKDAPASVHTAPAKPAAKPAAPAPKPLAPLKRAAVPPKSAAPAAPVKPAAPKPPAKPLAPLKRAGTPGTAAAAATATLPMARPAAPAKPAAPVKPAAPAKPKAAPAVKKETAETAKKPKLSVGKICAIFGGAAAVALVAAYVIVALTYQKTFLPNTKINGIDVSNMTREEAETALLDSKPTKDLVFVKADGEQVVFTPDSYKASYSLPENALDGAFGENRWLWIKKIFAPTEYTTDFVFNYSQEQLRTGILRYEWGSETSQDAYITMGTDGYYEIVPETMGDKFDEAVLTSYVNEQLAGEIFTIQMLDSGCYDGYEADVISSDLTETLEQCNRFASCSITFDFSDRTKVVTGQMIADWVSIKNDGSYAFNTESIGEFVAEMANETDTYGKSRTFHATLDGTITVPWTDLSMYGWQINQSATVEQIVELIEAGEAVTVQPKYTDWGYGYCREEDDIGNTYIEVDISAQHVWYYVDGSLSMDSDCVTGTETDPSRITPRGIFEIWSHESPRKLGTYAVQGYETWVDYWMPVNYGGIGLHDMGRSAFGGDIYMYSGSHGCINLPHSFAESLFYATENGIPVIIHD